MNLRFPVLQRDSRTRLLFNQHCRVGTVAMLTIRDGLSAQRHFRRIARKSNSFGRMRQDIVLWQPAETLAIIFSELQREEIMRALTISNSEAVA